MLLPGLRIAVMPYTRKEFALIYFFSVACRAYCVALVFNHYIE